MWFPFRKKTVQSYVEKIIKLAREIKLDLPAVYETGKSKNILNLLQAIKRFDVEEFQLIKKETGSKKLMDECLLIYKLADEAIKDVQEKYAFEKAEEVIDKIVGLEAFLIKEYETEIRFVPSKNLGKILGFSPREAIENGYLYRGVLQDDYRKIRRGLSIIARAPGGKVSLAEHILDQTNNPNTQYISLTADVYVARRFGKVIAVDVRKLKGHLFQPSDIERMTMQDTRVKKLRRKNTEFILGPSRVSPAIIPADAVVI